MPLTTVYIPDADGREFATNVLADSIEEAVEEVVEFFSDRFWKGPKPKSGTVLRILPMGGTARRIKLPRAVPFIDLCVCRMLMNPAASRQRE